MAQVPTITIHVKAYDNSENYCYKSFSQSPSHSSVADLNRNGISYKPYRLPKGCREFLAELGYVPQVLLNLHRLDYAL